MPIHSSALGAIGIAPETTPGVPADINDAYWIVVESADFQEEVGLTADEGWRNSMVQTHGHVVTKRGSKGDIKAKGRLSAVGFGLAAVLGDVTLSMPLGDLFEHTIGLAPDGNVPSYTIFEMAEGRTRVFPGQRASGTSLSWSAGDLVEVSTTFLGFPALETSAVTPTYNVKDVPLPGWNTVASFAHEPTIATPSTGTAPAPGGSVTIAFGDPVEITVSDGPNIWTAILTEGTYATGNAQAAQLQTAIRAADGLLADVTVTHSGGTFTFTSPSGLNFSASVNPLCENSVTTTGGVPSTTETVADVESGSIDITRTGAEAVHLATGTPGPRAVAVGPIGVTGKLTVLFDAQLYDDYVAGRVKALRIRTGDVVVGTAVIDLPAVRLMNAPINRGSTVVKLDLEFTAEGAEGVTGYTPIEAVVTCGVPVIG